MFAIWGKADMKLGWTEGSNLQLELRWSADDAGKAKTSAKELVNLPQCPLLTRSGHLETPMSPC